MGIVEIILIAALVGIFMLVVRGVGRASYEAGGGCGCVGERRPLPTFDDDEIEDDESEDDVEEDSAKCSNRCNCTQEDSDDGNRRN